VCVGNYIAPPVAPDARPSEVLAKFTHKAISRGLVEELAIPALLFLKSVNRR
jgi:hypothetical protein